MSNPIRLLVDWPAMGKGRAYQPVEAGQIIWQHPLEISVQTISKHELHIWFEPRWSDARYLARRFPHCLICSIPTESDTINLHRVPKWRPKRNVGQV